MEKITEKQKAYLEDLSEEAQRLIRDIDALTKVEADVLIKEFLNNKPKVTEKPKVNTNSVQFGLALKMVYQHWVHKKVEPLNNPIGFQEEVMKTYFLFEFK